MYSIGKNPEGWQAWIQWPRKWSAVPNPAVGEGAERSWNKHKPDTIGYSTYSFLDTLWMDLLRPHGLRGKFVLPPCHQKLVRLGLEDFIWLATSVNSIRVSLHCSDWLHFYIPHNSPHLLLKRCHFSCNECSTMWLTEPHLQLRSEVPWVSISDATVCIHFSSYTFTTMIIWYWESLTMYSMISLPFWVFWQRRILVSCRCIVLKHW
jgi:hypothetical protein